MSTDTSPPPPTSGQERRGYPPLSALRRSRSDRKALGVAGGLGQWAGVDPLVFRVLFVVLTVFGGSGLLLYALGWLLVPEDGETESEAQRLVKAGVKELLVISQDTSAYGVDVKYRTGFWNGAPVKTRMTELCEALSTLGVWVRLHYVYPYPHVDELIPLMAAGKILPYLDIPFQHSSPRILKLMKRPAASAKTLQRVRAWRDMCPGITLRSTFIVGFPGESEAEFEELLGFLEDAQLDRVGAFAYSPVDGAKANALPDPVDEDVKQERLERFMATQAKISAAKLERKIGSTLKALVDHVDADGAIARTSADAPEIDGVLRIRDGSKLKPGQFVDVLVEASDEHDLSGRLVATH